MVSISGDPMEDTARARDRMYGGTDLNFVLNKGSGILRGGGGAGKTGRSEEGSANPWNDESSVGEHGYSIGGLKNTE